MKFRNLANGPALQVSCAPDSKMKNRFAILLFFSVFLAGVAACAPGINVKATPAVTPTRSMQALGYDARAETILIYENVGTMRPEPPGQAQCARSRNPILRVWGDGLVLLRKLGSQAGAPTLYSGQLDPARLDAVMALLVKSGFFTYQAPPEMPNPAGNWQEIGGNLKTQHVRYRSGNPPGYQEMLGQIKPALKPLRQSDVPRLKRLIAGAQPCVN